MHFGSPHSDTGSFECFILINAAQNSYAQYRCLKIVRINLVCTLVPGERLFQVTALELVTAILVVGFEIVRIEFVGLF